MTGMTNANAAWLHVETVTEDNKTCTANTHTDLTIDLSGLSGTPIGIVGFDFENATSSGTNCSFCHAYDMHVSGTNAYVNIRNHNASAAKIKIILYVLCEN